MLLLGASKHQEGNDTFTEGSPIFFSQYASGTFLRPAVSTQVFLILLRLQVNAEMAMKFQNVDCLKFENTFTLTFTKFQKVHNFFTNFWDM
jgi:hypothetical protein